MTDHQSRANYPISAEVIVSIELRASEKVCSGQVVVKSFSKKDRYRRSIVRWGIGLGATIISAFVPVAHFITVPLGLILTPFVAISSFRTTGLILRGEGFCPGCAAKFNITRRRAIFPFRDVCEKCVRSVTISQALS